VSTRREFLKVLGIGSAGLAVPSLFSDSARAVSAGRPNILFILVDDLGWADVGCYGSTFYETPNIDRLAESGMRFTDAYAACPVCSPTRASIVTGKYPARLHLTNYLVGRRGGKLEPAEYIDHLPLEEVTVAEAMKEHGYTTFFAGKWHLGGEAYHPNRQGFDVSKCNGGGGPWGAYGNWQKLKDNPYEVGGYFSPYGNPHLPDGPKGEYLTDRLTDETVRFIRKHKDRPFMAYLSFHSVHNPLQAKEQYVKYFREKLERMPEAKGPQFVPEGRTKSRQIQNNPVYAAMIRSVDENVGKAVGALEELDLAENTVVFFMSDNGGLSTAEGHNTSNMPLRGGKGWLYEGGIREPMIVRWPAVVKPGSVCDVPVISTDFYPTFLDLAGLPLKSDQHMDGVSFLPLLKGGKKLDREAIYWHYPHYSNQGAPPGCAIRAGDYKLIEYFEDNSIELFDLRKDIGEHNDLSKEMPDKVAKLRKMLANWQQEVDARIMKEK